MKPPTALITRAFYYSTALILLCTSFAKLLSIIGSSPELLRQNDFLLQVPLVNVFWCASVAELLGACFLLTSQDSLMKSLLIAFFGGSFLLYQTFYYFLDAPLPCPCLGTLYKWLPIQEQYIRMALKVTIGYMCSGGLSLLWAQGLLSTQKQR